MEGKNERLHFHRFFPLDFLLALLDPEDEYETDADQLRKGTDCTGLQFPPFHLFILPPCKNTQAAINCAKRLRNIFVLLLYKSTLKF